MISYHCLFCHGYEDHCAKSVGVLAIDLMTQMPPIANSWLEMLYNIPTT
jgi:hypothetical protein